MCTRFSSDSDRVKKRKRKEKKKKFFLITIQCSRAMNIEKYIPHTSVSAVSSCNRSYPIERYNSRARVDESCGSRRYTGTTHESTTRVSSSRLLSLARDRAYTRILITRVVSIHFLCTSEHRSFYARSSIPRKRRTHAFIYNVIHLRIYRRIIISLLRSITGKERTINFSNFAHMDERCCRN